MEKQNKKVGRTSQAIEWNDQKEKEKTDELRNLNSEVVKFSLRYVVRSASLALAYDGDRNDLVARFLWLRVLCAYP